MKTRRGLPQTTVLLLLLAACGSASGAVRGDPADDGRAVEEQVKETIPLAEEEEDRRTVLRSAVTAFNSCLIDAGYTFRGFAGDGQTDAAVTEDPAYQAALQHCNAQSGIGDLRAEFAESRSERTPDQIREANQQILKVIACLRSKGWQVDDPTQDQTGGLNLRQVLQGADIDIRGNEEARACFSEMRLNRG